MADHEAVPQNLGKIVQDPATRRWIYGLAASLIVLLQAYNLLSPEEASAWANVASSAVALATAGISIPNTPSKAPTEPLG